MVNPSLPPSWKRKISSVRGGPAYLAPFERQEALSAVPMTLARVSGGVHDTEAHAV